MVVVAAAEASLPAEAAEEEDVGASPLEVVAEEEEEAEAAEVPVAEEVGGAEVEVGEVERRLLLSLTDTRESSSPAARRMLW